MSLLDFIDNDSEQTHLLDKIEPKEWRKYKDDLKITTDALWVSSDTIGKNSKKFVIPKRMELPGNSSSFHGLWIPEIPFQMITRFTEKDDTVWSVFGGSGTDYKVSQILGRKCIINDLNPIEDYIQQGDSRTFDPGQKVKLALIHPPYHNIVKYSDDVADGSNQPDMIAFLQWFKEVITNVDKYVMDGGHIVIACSNVYVNSEELELGLYLFMMVQQMGYTLKSHIIKDFGETKGSGGGKDYNINYYRQLKGGYNNFYGDNIGILKKTKSRNKVNDILKFLSEI